MYVRLGVTGRQSPLTFYILLVGWTKPTQVTLPHSVGMGVTRRRGQRAEPLNVLHSSSKYKLTPGT